ncbi:hypothetical protein Cni_G24841 [Canna indica]|uniref:Filament-like plant protein n=1 Tax=Canna indica TaxID=4628 RepID=A0AAQ3KWH7_9LILI|nr:hypothetical protein Cni_G24841 [Canna indica]
MDRRSWLWRRRSSDKSPGKTESSGSASSDRHSDEQETSRNSSPNYAQTSEVASKDVSHDNDETIRTLNEKLSAALSNISAKEDLVKQHAKVAEEAILGWENSEKEVSFLKQQLEVASKKSSSLEDKVIHLDAAIEECLRQLRQTKEDQEQKVHDVIIKKTHEWESEKTELEIQLIQLRAQMEAKAEISTSFDRELCSKIESLEEEKCALKDQLATLAGDLQLRTLELELITSTAEAASKQHLNNIKRVTKLEAECCQLRADARKSSLAHEQKLISNSHYAESVIDSQSDAGEEFLSLDNGQSYSDSWSSILIAELDKFRKEKANARHVTTSMEIHLMDDFLEMEKLVALPETDHGSSSIVHDDDLDHTSTGESSSRKELESIRLHMIELEEMVEKMTREKVEMETTLAVTSNRLKSACDQLVAAKGKLVELQRQLNWVNGDKHVLELELELAEGEKNELENQLVSSQAKNTEFQERINLSKRKLEEEKELSDRLKAKCEDIDATESKRKEMELQLESAYSEIAELKNNISLLETKVEEEKILSTELASRCWKMEALKRKKEELECQLQSTNLELHKLHENFHSLDRNLEEEKKISAELVAKCQSMEVIDAKKKELEYELAAKCLEVVILDEKVNILEGKLEEERTRSSELGADTEMAEAKRKELVAQLELAHAEVWSLQDKLATLEKHVEENRAKSEPFATRFHSLQHQKSGNQKVTELHLSASTNGVMKLKQENSTAARAAGKLAECQETIASLNQQLKSLADFDYFMLETDEQESNGDLPGFKGQSKVLDPSISLEKFVLV